jgi:hypothetical protein
LKQIKITYRAVFEQPLGLLNPMCLRIPGNCPVEVFEAGTGWKVREIASPRRQVYEKLGALPGIEYARKTVENSFKKQIEPWQMWATPPGSTQERMLLPFEVRWIPKEGRDRAYWLEPEDYTHILHAPTIPAGAKIPPAACGAKIPTNSFISNRANVEPTCSKCAKVWREHYQQQEAPAK